MLQRRWRPSRHLRLVGNLHREARARVEPVDLEFRAELLDHGAHDTARKTCLRPARACEPPMFKAILLPLITALVQYPLLPSFWLKGDQPRDSQEQQK